MSKKYQHTIADKSKEKVEWEITKKDSGNIHLSVGGNTIIIIDNTGYVDVLSADENDPSVYHLKKLDCRGSIKAGLRLKNNA